jgi:hypothetical protein
MAVARRDWRGKNITIGCRILWPRVTDFGIEMAEGHLQSIDIDPYGVVLFKVLLLRASRTPDTEERVVTLNVTANVTVVE